MLLQTFSSRVKNCSSRSPPNNCSLNCTARPAYCRTWTVSGPVGSSKNHPQLVYISMRCRCISSSLNTRTDSSADRSRTACSPRKRSTVPAERSMTALAYSSRAVHGSLSSSFAPTSYKVASSSRNQFIASRSGRRHACFQCELPPELQPQSLSQRAVPCIQLQDVCSRISTSWEGGCCEKYSP